MSLPNTLNPDRSWTTTRWSRWQPRNCSSSPNGSAKAGGCRDGHAATTNGSGFRDELRAVVAIDVADTVADPTEGFSATIAA